MTEPTSNPSLQDSFATTVAARLGARARELTLAWLEVVRRQGTDRAPLGGSAIAAPIAEGTLSDDVPELIRAFAAALADDAASDAAARVERELTRLARLRRAQGRPLGDVLRELGLLQDVVLDAILAEAAGRDGIPGDAVLVVVTRYDRTARAMVDVTLRLFEQDLLTRRAQRASLLGGFARAVTHELRNRVNAARLCLSVFRSASEERQEELLATLDESLQQLEDAVSDVFSVTLVQARELPAEGRLQPLPELLEHLRRDFDELGFPGRIQVRVAQPIPDLIVDAGKVQLALLNLVTSALKRVDRAKGARWVEIRVVAGAQRDEWRVDVEDNGVGLPPREQAVGEAECVPEPDLPLGSRQEVGLAMASEAVRQLGGRLWVGSNVVGGGTTISFSLRAGATDRESRAAVGA